MARIAVTEYSAIVAQDSMAHGLASSRLFARARRIRLGISPVLDCQLSRLTLLRIGASHRLVVSQRNPWIGISAHSRFPLRHFPRLCNDAAIRMVARRGLLYTATIMVQLLYVVYNSVTSLVAFPQGADVFVISTPALAGVLNMLVVHDESSEYADSLW